MQIQNAQARLLIGDAIFAVQSLPPATNSLACAAGLYQMRNFRKNLLALWACTNTTEQEADFAEQNRHMLRCSISLTAAEVLDGHLVG